MFKPFLFQLRADTWFTLDNLGSADAIEGSIDQTLFPVEFSACCQAAQQQGNCVETRKILKVFSLLFACSGLLVEWELLVALGIILNSWSQKRTTNAFQNQANSATWKMSKKGANSVAVKRLSLNEILLFTSPNFAWRSMRTKVFAVGLPFLPCC